MKRGKGRSSADSIQDAVVGARAASTQGQGGLTGVGTETTSVTGQTRTQPGTTTRVARGSVEVIATANNIQDVDVGAHAAATQGRGGADREERADKHHSP